MMSHKSSPLLPCSQPFIYRPLSSSTGVGDVFLENVFISWYSCISMQKMHKYSISQPLQSLPALNWQFTVTKPIVCLLQTTRLLRPIYMCIYMQVANKGYLSIINPRLFFNTPSLFYIFSLLLQIQNPLIRDGYNAGIHKKNKNFCPPMNVVC